MGNYFEPVLSEEQLSAYLDGMLSAEENNVVEELISSSPEMAEIQDSIDSVDSTYLYENDYEIPIECMADDFSLPDIGYVNLRDTDSYDENDIPDVDSYNKDYGNNDTFDDVEFHDDSSETELDDLFVDEGYDDISF